jgi:hypothetical protein
MVNLFAKRKLVVIIIRHFPEAKLGGRKRLFYIVIDFIKINTFKFGIGG